MTTKLRINRIYLRILFNFILITLVFLIHLSFIRAFDSWFGYLNLSLIFLIFVLEINGLTWSLGWILGLGFFFDIFYFLPFGYFLLTFFIVVLISHILLVRVFTNRSLYSYLGLVFVGTIVYEVVLNLLIYLLTFYSSSRIFFLFIKDFWNELGQELIVNWLATFIFFYIFSFFNKRFNAVFIKK